MEPSGYNKGAGGGGLGGQRSQAPQGASPIFGHCTGLRPQTSTQRAKWETVPSSCTRMVGLRLPPASTTGIL
eukprot:11158987-Lingulodinium_polyedra.AAC.1